MRYELRTILLMAPTLALFEAMQLIKIVKNGWQRHWLAALHSVWRDRHKITAERRAWRMLRRAGDGHVLRGGDPPFRANLLEGRVERFAYGILRSVGHLNWRLARPLHSHAS